MIGFLIGFLPFAVCMLLAHRAAKQRLNGSPHRTAVAAPTEIPAPPRKGSIARTASAPNVSPDDMAEGDPALRAWTALDDRQLERLLKESSL